MKRLAALLLVFAVMAPAAHAATVQVVRCATAEIVIAPGRQNARFTEAELRYEGMNLVATVAELDSTTGLITISEGVEISTPGFRLVAHSCEVDTARGRLTAEGALRLVHFAEGVTAGAERGELAVAPGSLAPVWAMLEGGVTVEWAEGVVFSGGRVEADFAQRLYTLREGFTGRISGALLPPRLRELAGGDVQLTGVHLVVQALEEEAGVVLQLTGTSVDAAGERFRLHCPAFAQRLPAREGLSAGGAMMAVRGTEDDPVTGWLAGQDGRELRFTALAFDRPAGDAPIRLSGSVRVEGGGFTLVAPSVEVTVQEGALHASITQRFRVYLSPEAFTEELNASLPGAGESRGG